MVAYTKYNGVMKMSKEFYQLKLNPTEGGIVLWLNKFYSFHETPCYHYCMQEWQRNLVAPCFVKKSETIVQSLKRRGIKFSRIHKTQSRKAFDTKEKAYNNFIFLKKRHLSHLKRDIKMINEVLKFDDEKSFGDLEDYGHSFLIPNTNELVLEEYIFD